LIVIILKIFVKFINHNIKMSIPHTKTYVKHLMAARDDAESKQGRPDVENDKHVRDALLDLFVYANRHGNVETVKWCHAQLERENVSRRLRRAEPLVPSGILDAVDDFYDPSPSPMRRPSANPALALSALDVYDWNPSPHIGLHPYSHNFPEAPARAFVNPFSNRPSALQEFVLPPAAINPDANVRCNRCNQMGHRRAACPNPPVPGHRGGKTRTNKHKKGKKSKKSKKH
jgi:hypothetical protein